MTWHIRELFRRPCTLVTTFSNVFPAVLLTVPSWPVSEVHNLTVGDLVIKISIHKSDIQLKATAKHTHIHQTFIFPLTPKLKCVNLTKKDEQLKELYRWDRCMHTGSRRHQWRIAVFRHSPSDTALKGGFVKLVHVDLLTTMNYGLRAIPLVLSYASPSTSWRMWTRSSKVSILHMIWQWTKDWNAEI